MSSASLRSSVRPILAATSAGSSRRTFATTLQRHKEWLAILPDKPNVLELRKKVKAGHYEGIQPLIAAGKLRAGGATFTKHPVEGEPAQFTGSIVVYAAKTAEEVHGIIKSDIYATSGVWDIEKAKVIPYVAAVREPLNEGQ